IGVGRGGGEGMAFTAAHPAKVERLVIVDIGPDIGLKGAERVSRMAADAPEDFGSVEEAVAYLRRYATLTSADAESALRFRVEHGVKKRPGGRYTWENDQ